MTEERLSLKGKVLMARCPKCKDIIMETTATACCYSERVMEETIIPERGCTIRKVPEVK